VLPAPRPGTAEPFQNPQHDLRAGLEGLTADALVGLVGLIQVAGTTDQRIDSRLLELTPVGAVGGARAGLRLEKLEEGRLQRRPAR
jgi:hypothetical protein